MFGVLVRRLQLFVVSGLGQDQFATFKIVNQFFDRSGDKAGCKLLRRFPESASDLVGRPVPTISFERGDQSLDSALPRPFLVDQRVPQIEEEPASILHGPFISVFAHGEGRALVEIDRLDVKFEDALC